MRQTGPPSARPERGPAGTRRHGLDDPARAAEIRARIRRKPALERWYRECYGSFRECLARCPGEGIALELGSGAGFVRRELPEVWTSDVLPYAGLGCVLDATALPFRDQSLRALLMLNVFHHVSDAESLLAEAERCLRPGGRVLLVDQHPGWIGGPVYRWAHDEPFDARASDWRFESRGPLSDANGALAWIVFRRDRERFERRFPGLRLVRYRTHTPLRYFLAGGLRRWSLLPGFAFGAATRLDAWLVRRSPEWGSFVDVELVRRGYST